MLLDGHHFGFFFVTLLPFKKNHCNKRIRDKGLHFVTNILHMLTCSSTTEAPLHHSSVKFSEISYFQVVRLCEEHQ